MRISHALAALTLTCTAACAQSPAPTSDAPALIGGKNFRYAAIEHTGPYTDYPAVLREYRDAAQQAGLKLTAPVMTLYWNSPLYVAPAQLKWDVGQALGAKDVVPAKSILVTKTFNYPKLAAATHRGSYLTTYETINRIYDWIAAQKLATAGGPCVERYLDLDAPAVPAAQVATEIWIPVK